MSGKWPGILGLCLSSSWDSRRGTPGQGYRLLQMMWTSSSTLSWSFDLVTGLESVFNPAVVAQVYIVPRIQEVEARGLQVLGQIWAKSHALTATW